ncbi:MAG TPA: DUF1015 domain-containing protein [Elusimicrobiota bacterium]|nr:DUF1015 domain-containing protein [Elusimicrobiota bacterium]
MAKISPFAALRFDPRKAPLSRALCPPYDVISPEQTASLRRHSINAIRVELPRGVGPSRYRAAAGVWKSWKKNGTVVSDGAPSFYVCEETFSQRGKSFRRRGFFAALDVRHGKKDILAHEKTLSKPKAERLRLLRALRVNTSPIFGLFKDPAGRARRALASARWKKPDASGHLDGVAYRLWRIDDEKLARFLSGLIAPQKILIADGHHRCEVARRYWAMTRRPRARGVLAYFCPEEDSGLVVLPTHRVVAGRSWREASQSRCRVMSCPSLRVLSARLAASKNPYAYGLFDGDFLLAEPKSAAGCKSGLGVEWLNRVLLSGVRPEDIRYTPDAEKAVTWARAGRSSAILVKPFPAAQIRRAVAAVGLLPPKSTYFYPKVPAGLVFKAAS